MIQNQKTKIAIAKKISFSSVKKLLVFPFLIWSFIVHAENPTIDVKKILYSFCDSLQTVKTATYKVENTERIGDKYLSGSQLIVYQKYPFQCKIEFVYPNTGSQVAYNSKNKDAVYSPIGFPFFDMSLDPLGSLMRRNNHHTVHEVGFDYIISIVKASLTDNFNKFELVQETNTTYIVEVTNPNFHYHNYTVKKGETIRTIAFERNLNEFLILERNDNVDFYDDIDEGDVIEIPTSYAKKVKLIIDKKDLMLKDILAYDEKGLFEEYHYSSMKKNVTKLNLELDN